MDFEEMTTSLWLFSILAVAERAGDKVSRKQALDRARLELSRRPEFTRQSELGRCATLMVMDAFSDGASRVKPNRSVSNLC